MVVEGIIQGFSQSHCHRGREWGEEYNLHIAMDKVTGVVK